MPKAASVKARSPNPVIATHEAPQLCFSYKTSFSQVWGEPHVLVLYGQASVFPAEERPGLSLDV
jgi:hypothetical protein